jgi:8-oxo-dGTP diphosphatase
MSDELERRAMSGESRPVVVVAAAVVERDGRVLLTRRLKGTHLEGTWEFPGGKCEPGETLEGCLARELTEELAVDAVVGRPLLVTRHAYPERTVELHFFEVTVLGDPAPQLGQELCWATREDLRSLSFPDADRALIDLLQRR